MSNPIKIHSFPLSGHAHRALLFAGLAGINHEIIHVDLGAGEHKTEAFLSLNPDAQVPVIEDGDVVIADSNAILVYLSRKYAPSFLPEDPILEAKIQTYLTMAAGEVAFGLCSTRLITLFGAPLDPEFTQTTAHKTLEKLERDLDGKQFLVGDQLTIADVAIYSYVFLAPEGGVSLDVYPNVLKFLATIESQKGFVPMIETTVGLRV